MKKLLPILILVFVASAFAQTSVTDLETRVKSQKIKDIVIQYDKFKDRTIISTKPINLIGGMEGGMAIVAGDMSRGQSRAQTVLMLQIGYSFKTEKLTATPEEYAIFFTSNSDNWNFVKGDNNLYMLYDDQRLELRPLAADSDIVSSPIRGRVSVSEKLGFGISRGDLEKIARAKKVELKLGDTKPRKWKNDWSERIQALLDLTIIETK